MKSMNFSLSTRLFTLTALSVCAVAAQAQTKPFEFAKIPLAYDASYHPAGSVLKVKLDTKLQSNKSKVGDVFTATVDMGKSKQYFGLPQGSKVEGHVTEVRAREGKVPGMISVDFDTIRLASGERYPIEASFMKFDKANVRKEAGRYVTTPNYAHNTNYVATGALVGVGAAVLTGSDVLAGGLIGALVGFLIGQNGGVHAQDLTLKPGTVMGVRFDKESQFTVYE